MVKSQRWYWPLLLLEGIIPTILSLIQRPKKPEDRTSGLSGQCEALIVGIKILKRLSTEEIYAQEIRRLGGPDFLTTLLVGWVCGTNDACSFFHAWLSTHAMMCLSNLTLPCGRPFLWPLAPPADGVWPAPVIWRAIKTVMRVILQTQSYMDALVAGITTLTHLVQLQTPDLQDSTVFSWATVGTPYSLITRATRWARAPRRWHP